MSSHPRQLPHLLIAAAALTAAACAGPVEVERCPERTTREGSRCVPTENLPIPPLADAGPARDAGPPVDGGVAVDGGAEVDAGSTRDAGQPAGIALPFWVDEHFAMSGFFPGPPAAVTVTEDCAEPSTDPASVCRRIVLNPNGGTFGGFFFQAPANNWGGEPGVAVAPGATRIRFRAWASGPGVSAKFGAGIDNDEPFADGWHVESAAMVLPTTPTELSVDIAQIRYERVVGGFLWVLETPDGATPKTFFLDNVRWE
jgi:hypothetical protein